MNSKTDSNSKFYKLKKRLHNASKTSGFFQTSNPLLLPKKSLHGHRGWGRTSTTQPSKPNGMGLFSDLLYCADCGRKTVFLQGQKYDTERRLRFMRCNVCWLSFVCACKAWDSCYMKSKVVPESSISLVLKPVICIIPIKSHCSKEAPAPLYTDFVRPTRHHSDRVGTAPVVSCTGSLQGTGEAVCGQLTKDRRRPASLCRWKSCSRSKIWCICGCQ